MQNKEVDMIIFEWLGSHGRKALGGYLCTLRTEGHKPPSPGTAGSDPSVWLLRTCNKVKWGFSKVKSFL